MPLRPGGEIEVAQRERFAAVGRVAATIAHELGTPLNSVLGYTQLLLQEEPDAHRREKLAIIESQVRRMIDTIQGVLDRTRGRQTPHAEVEVGAVIDDAVATLSPLAATAGVTLRTSIPVPLPPYRGDAIAVRQILINLVKNSIEAAGSGGSVEVAARADAEAGIGPALALEVSDTGPGVAQEERALIFEPLYTTKQAENGTGLGLAIALGLAREHGGRIVVGDGASGGAVFCVSLPLER